MRIRHRAGLTCVVLFTATLNACSDSTISAPEMKMPPSEAAGMKGRVGVGSRGYAQEGETKVVIDPAGTAIVCTEERDGVGLGSGGRTECPGGVVEMEITDGQPSFYNGGSYGSGGRAGADSAVTAANSGGSDTTPAEGENGGSYGSGGMD